MNGINLLKYTLLLSLLCGFIGESHAQINRERFGKNRVQFKNFNWRYYSSDNFDVYFYDGGQDNALIAAKFLEKEFERITDVIGYAPYTKTKIFLYNSTVDLQQSNVGVKGKSYTVGGQTDFVKSQVEVAYPGSMVAFRNELVQQISEMLINDMMFGGSLTDMFQSAYLLTLPEWFIQGAARYIAQGWSIEMDDFMRELFHEKRNVKLTKFTGEESAIVGQSVWNFIAARYGRSSISNILNLTRIIRNEESSIVNTLGIPFRLFSRQWQSFYAEMSSQTADVYQYPLDDDRIRNKNRQSLKYNQVAFSPSGRFLAYSENKNGRYKVIIRDLERKRAKTIHTSGFQLIDQDIDQDVPLLDWANDQILGIVGTERGQNYLWLYDQGNKRKRAIQLRRFNQVKDFDLNESARLAVMSADLNGRNDLFLYNPNRNTFKRITTDIYDDLHPRFIPKSDEIIFSSNRPNDSLYFASTKARDVQLNQDIEDNFNIFRYDPESDPTDSLLSRITNTISKDIKPIPEDENTIYYLSDQQGIYNLYRYQIRDSLFTQISNYAVSLQDFDIDFKNNRIGYIMLADERDYVFLEEGVNLDQSTFTPKTQRQQAIQARMVSQRLAENQKQRRTSTASSDSTSFPKSFVPRDSLTVQPEVDLDSLTTPNDALQINADTLPKDLIDTDAYSFGEREAPQLEEGMIDTDNYAFDAKSPATDEAISTDGFRFESDQKQPASEGNSFLSRYRRLRRETRIDGPVPYETRFSADNVITSLTIDPLRNFGFHIQVQMNDMLENHRFSGGIVQFTDLRSASVFAEYQYLKNRVDFTFRYERDGIFRDANDQNIQKYTMNHFQVGASVPFNVSTRLEINPFIANTHYIDLDPNPPAPPAPLPESENTVFFGGLKTGLVFDNTLNYGLNKYEGTKARAFFTHYQGLNDVSRSFSNIEVDIRHYQKIHRELTLVGRLYYGNFFGNNPQSYLLGGMHNWIFNRTDDSEEEDPLAIQQNVDNSNILFTEFVDLRGFNYNKFNGTDVLTFTAELRFPVVRYFYRGPIASNFFRNLEFIGFYDIGSSWTGPSPFREENSINTEVISDGGPFVAEIQNFKFPWLMSYGAGIRTVLLGYYLKFDLAYPIEDRVVADDPRFYFTLGYDF
ncbi:BamA/TamA family outer membrane protein [Tunicatimonas pelagia]|uniref:BamA/TamA family outer membrane protein n=1 Tax=Tunicatimonas pelagia TaxID=931531 RepID=UPI002667103A|nr:BamA/TamA family outer membrane protein [Tunicatimonas pelagia]WKN43977.1 BamA/TamA family outer membrane protein [Tunicatimonas pelagia]